MQESTMTDDADDSNEAPMIVVLPSPRAIINTKNSTARVGLKPVRKRRSLFLGLVFVLLVSSSFVASHHVQKWLSYVVGSQSSSGGLETSLKEKEEGIMATGHSILDTVEFWNANGQPFGGCGEGQNHTSLAQTAARFASAEFVLYPFPNSYAHDGAKNSFVQLSLTFPAVDGQGRPRTRGGDQFVTTLWSWTQSSGNNRVAYKQAAAAKDLGTGVYQVTFILPRYGIDHVQLDLMHFYSCYQGLGPHKPGEAFFDLDRGPRNLTHPLLEKLLLEQTEIMPPQANGSHAFEFLQSTTQPDCEASQRGLDSFTQGIWVENTPEVALGKDITLDATWKSVICHRHRGDGKEAEVPIDVLRVGDSTMPRKTLEIGDPFHHYTEFNFKFNHHKRWIEYLMDSFQLRQHPKDPVNNNKVLVFSGGLHQLFQRDRYGSPHFQVVRGYNVPTAVDLLTRMFCQLALVHTDRKLMLVGVGPVHQQHFDTVDNTDQNVLWFNALLRQRIVEEHGGRLADICANAELSTLWSIPDEEGNAQNRTISRQAFAAFGYKETLAEQKLALILSKLDSPSVYGNRVVAYADIHDILLARPECFSDKIHDHKLIRYHGKPTLQATHHNDMIETLARMRAEMKDP